MEALSHHGGMSRYYPLAGPTWRRAAVGWLIVLAGFLAMAGFARSYDYFPADRWVSREVQGLDAESFGYAARLTELAVTPPYLFAILLIVYAVARFVYRGRGQVLMLLAIPFGAGIGALAKDHWVDRPAPTLTQVANNNESFPSSHALTAVLTFGLLFYFTKDIKRAWIRLPMQASCLYGVIFASLGGVYRGTYWFSDTYGAALLGALILGSVIWLDRVVESRRQVSRGRVAYDSQPQSRAKDSGSQAQTFALTRWSAILATPARRWLTALGDPTEWFEWVFAIAIYLALVAFVLAAVLILITLIV